MQAKMYFTKQKVSVDDLSSIRFFSAITYNLWTHYNRLIREWYPLFFLIDPPTAWGQTLQSQFPSIFNF